MTTAYFLLDRFSPEAQQRILADPTVLKLAQTERGDFRHGMQAGPRGFLFDTALAYQQHSPLSRDQVNSVSVADDHPDWAWFLLHLDPQGLT